MKRDCSTCICKEGSCYPSTTIFDKDKTCKSYSPDYEGYIAELEKENADLKCECRTCVYTDSPCVRSDYPSKDGVCSHYKNVFEENAELKGINTHTLSQLNLDNGELITQLTKAKEIITDLLNVFVYDLADDEMDTGHIDTKLKAEQFLKEIKK